MSLDRQRGVQQVRGGCRHPLGGTQRFTDAVPLTSNELKILGAIIEQLWTHGRCTVRDLSRRFDTSTSTVHAALRSLKEQSLIEWSPGRAATLQLRVAIVVR